jgi:hypothetical protein
VIGVYLNPPDHAVVLCCDEKSQCQALQRSQPGLPLAQGHIRTLTHDYYRHGTVTHWTTSVAKSLVRWRHAIGIGSGSNS